MAKLDFTKSIYENRQIKGAPLLVAHRGVCCANIPCNTLASFKIAIDQGADVVEIDVSKSADGKFFVFHPGTEPIYLKSEKRLSRMTASEIDALRLVNQDDTRTSYKVPTLAEVFAFLKDKVYINVDKFWTDVKGISEAIREAGVEKQVIVKTPVKDGKMINDIKEYADGLMFLPIISSKDNITEKLVDAGINVIGAEILFSKDDESVIGDEYIKSMHDKKLLLWANPIIYDEKAVICGIHTDDTSLTKSPDLGWGWLIDKGIDMLQTDWLLMLKIYIENRGK